MLLEFRISNYKSFVEETVFSMVPSKKEHSLSYSVLREKCGKKEYSALSSAVVYGPNASGKSNMVGAMETLKTIIERGNIMDGGMPSTPNFASYKLNLIPNLNVQDKPTSFGVKFVEDGHCYDYWFSAYLGDFLQKDYQRHIENETLHIDGDLIFERSNSLHFGQRERIRPYVQLDVKNNLDLLRNVVSDNLSGEELFLCNGFKTIFAKEFTTKILSWFKDCFIVIYRSDTVRSGLNVPNADNGAVYVKNFITDAAKEFGVTSNVLAYKGTKKGNSELCSLFTDRKTGIPAEIFESFGTIRFVNEFPLVMLALQNGATLVVDEFDASIHPMAVMNIINIFHNDDINVNRAQLVFNTHNPIFLNKSLFRKDEIKFVERNTVTGDSDHYSLSDFHGRIPNDYMKHYFVNRFGAIKDIDFAPLVERVLRKEGGLFDEQTSK